MFPGAEIEYAAKGDADFLLRVSPDVRNKGKIWLLAGDALQSVVINGSPCPVKTLNDVRVVEVEIGPE